MCFMTFVFIYSQILTRYQRWMAELNYQKLNPFLFNLFSWLHNCLFHYYVSILKVTLKTVKKRAISCFETNKYSFLCECCTSDIELS